MRSSTPQRAGKAFAVVLAVVVILLTLKDCTGARWPWECIGCFKSGCQTWCPDLPDVIVREQ